MRQTGNGNKNRAVFQRQHLAWQKGQVFKTWKSCGERQHRFMSKHFGVFLWTGGNVAASLPSQLCYGMRSCLPRTLDSLEKALI